MTVTRRALPLVVALIHSTSSLLVTAHADDWLPLPSGEITRIAFGSCSNQYLHQPIWNDIVAANPDLFLHLGDVIYGDVAPPGVQVIPPEVDVIEKMRMDYAFLANKPSFKHLKKNVPFMAIWDDHDLGQNDGGVDFPRKTESRDLLLDFLEVPAYSDRRISPGLYESKIFGPEGRRVQIIMLDTRYFRDPLTKSNLSQEEAKARGILGRYVPNNDPASTLLGDEQWLWLELQLTKPAEVRLLVSSIQVVAGNKGAEGWGNFPAELARLYALIDKTDAGGVVILSGDVHFSELSVSRDAVKYPLYDFTSSPLRQFGVGMTGWEELKNDNRVGEAFANDNFGVVDIDWSAKPYPNIQLMLIAEGGRQVFKHEISLGDLR
jgi:alkaline phosphatase D